MMKETDMQRMLRTSMSHPKRYCGNCKWYATFEGVCCNGNSEHRANFLCLDDICEEWEEIESEMDKV